MFRKLLLITILLCLSPLIAVPLQAATDSSLPIPAAVAARYPAQDAEVTFVAEIVNADGTRTIQPITRRISEIYSKTNDDPFKKSCRAILEASNPEEHLVHLDIPGSLVGRPLSCDLELHKTEIPEWALRHYNEDHLFDVKVINPDGRSIPVLYPLKKICSLPWARKQFLKQLKSNVEKIEDQQAQKAKEKVQRDDAQAIQALTEKVAPRPYSLRERIDMSARGHTSLRDKYRTWGLFKRFGFGDGTRRPEHIPSYEAFKQKLATCADDAGISAETRAALLSPGMLLHYYVEGDSLLNEDSPSKRIIPLGSSAHAATILDDPIQKELIEYWGAQFVDQRYNTSLEALTQDDAENHATVIADLQEKTRLSKGRPLKIAILSTGTIAVIAGLCYAIAIFKRVRRNRITIFKVTRDLYNAKCGTDQLAIKEILRAHNVSQTPAVVSAFTVIAQDPYKVLEAMMIRRNRLTDEILKATINTKSLSPQVASAVTSLEKGNLRTLP